MKANEHTPESESSAGSERLGQTVADAALARGEHVHILNLGAGVQSTALYLLSMQGRIQRFDYAVFADTQDEPGAEERRLGLPDPPESVYAHLDWLIALRGPPILVRTRGQISADLLRGENSTGQRFASIPLYTSVAEGGEEGQVRRQCTKEYKIEVIERAIRREVLGLKPRQRVPKGVTVHQYIGISWDERTRAADIIHKVFSHKPANWLVDFPLLTMNGEMKPGWTRDDCDRYNQANVPHKVYGSACIHCPFHDDQEWQRLKGMPTTWDRIVQIDMGIRTPGTIVNRGLDQKLYLHRDCRPIDQIDFANEKQMGFALECEGGCGL